MKCKDCSACRKGWFESKPDAYVCIGVREPFEIRNIDTECTEYDWVDGHSYPKSYHKEKIENGDLNYRTLMYRLYHEHMWDEHCAGSLTLYGRKETARLARTYIWKLEQELETVKRERDAAVRDLNLTTPCDVCMNNKGCPGWPRFNPCQWQWRGVCPENTEVQGDD